MRQRLVSGSARTDSIKIKHPEVRTHCRFLLAYGCGRFVPAWKGHVTRGGLRQLGGGVSVVPFSAAVTVNIKVDPDPSSERTQIVPPKPSMILLQTARPSPLPGTSRLPRRLNGMNIRTWSSGAIPRPFPRSVTPSPGQPVRP